MSLFFLVLSSFAFRAASGIKGTVVPAESAGLVLAIVNADTLRMDAVEGAFHFTEVKPGTYKVIVGAKAPYKDFVKEGIEVKEGELVDLGNITLEK